MLDEYDDTPDDEPHDMEESECITSLYWQQCAASFDDTSQIDRLTCIFEKSPPKGHTAPQEALRCAFPPGGGTAGLSSFRLSATVRSTTIQRNKT